MREGEKLEEASRRLEEMQTKLIFHERIQAKAERQRAKLRRAQIQLQERERQERILRQEVERQEKTNIHLEQKFTSLEDEVEVKTVKLKKLIKRFQESKNEIKDMKAQNQREREDLWEMRRELQRLSNSLLSIISYLHLSPLDLRVMWNGMTRRTSGIWFLRRIKFIPYIPYVVFECEAREFQSYLSLWCLFLTFISFSQDHSNICITHLLSTRKSTLEYKLNYYDKLNSRFALEHRYVRLREKVRDDLSVIMPKKEPFDKNPRYRTENLVQIPLYVRVRRVFCTLETLTHVRTTLARRQILNLTCRVVFRKHWIFQFLFYEVSVHGGGSFYALW